MYEPFVAGEGWREEVPEQRDFLTELTALLNRHSMENDSNTPDFILAKYMFDCLQAFNFALQLRKSWYVNENAYQTKRPSDE